MGKKSLTSEDIKFLYNELRKATITWSGRKECLALARKKVFVRRAKNGKPIYKYHWQCAKCSEWYKNETDMEVDHIVEIGGYTGFDGNWNNTIANMFPRPVEDHLQCLCVICHQRKTKKYLAACFKYDRKKK